MVPATDLTFEGDGFEQLFFRKVNASGKVFFWGGDEQSDSHREVLAKRRKLCATAGVPPSWRMEDLMPPAHVERVKAYRRLAVRKDPNAHWFVNLSDSPDQRPTMAAGILPALLTNSETFMLDVADGCNRYMEPLEVLSTLLLPVPRGHPSSSSSGDRSGMRKQHRMTWEHVLHTLAPMQLKRLAGNGMSMVQIGAVLLFALASHKRVCPTDQSAVGAMSEPAPNSDRSDDDIE